MALEHPHTMTVEEYFQLEEHDTEHRYEYVDGYVYMMAGRTVNHDTIKSNIERYSGDFSGARNVAHIALI